MTATPAHRVLVKRKRTQAPLDGLLMTDINHPTKRLCFYRLDRAGNDHDMESDDSRLPMLDLAKNQSLLSGLDELAIEAHDDGTEEDTEEKSEYVIDSYRIEPKMDPKVFKSELIGQVVWDANNESRLVWADELGSEDSEEFEDDSDSNAESNWRNEYPDESDFDEESWQDSSDEYGKYVSSSDDDNSEEWY